MTNRLAEIKSGHLVGDDDVDWLIAEIEQARAFIQEDAIAWNKRVAGLKCEIERLEAVAIVCDVARHLGVAEGKEAAAKIADKFPIVGSTKIGDAIRAEISKLP